jgi:hypothetical protein
MSTWTIREQHSGRVRYSPDGGGHARFAQFEYTLSSISANTGVIILKGGQPDAQREKWFPNIKAGIERVCQERASDGKAIVGVQIDITKVVAHWADTDEDAMDRAGRMLIRHHLEPRLVEIDP